MDEPGYDALVASIYAAAMDDTLWPATLDRLQSAFGGSAAALMSLPRDPLRARIFATRAASAADYLEHWNQRNPLRPPNVVLNADDVVSDRMMVPREALVRTDYFNGFLLPEDLAHLLAVKLIRTPDSDVTLNIMRGARQEAFAPADLRLAGRLAGHFLAAVRLAACLPNGSLPRGAGSGVLDRLAAGTMLVDQAGDVLYLNGAAGPCSRAGTGWICGSAGCVRRTRARRKRWRGMSGGPPSATGMGGTPARSPSRGPRAHGHGRCSWFRWRSRRRSWRRSGQPPSSPSSIPNERRCRRRRGSRGCSD
ncbi:MAG: hypothetical protein ACREFY_04095 [Acetobacteraceae bacterium]